MRLWRTVLKPVATRVSVLAKVARTLAFAVPWFASGVASAVSITWSASGGRFADGGTFTGTFVQDPAELRPSTWNLNVAGGGSSFPARSYTPANSGVLMLDWLPNAELTYHFIDPSAGKRQLRLTPARALDGSVTSVPLSLLGNGAVECFNCAPYRDITGGSLVLVAATPALTLVSIAPDPVVVGSTTTATISIDAIAAFGPPTGAVTIFDSGNNPKCSMTLPAASCSFAATVPGGHTLHALYVGDTNYASTTSNQLSFTVLPAAVTTVTLAPLLPNPTMIGAATTATVTVGNVAGYGPPTGLITVFFYGSGDTTLCTITLPATMCTFAPKTGGNQTIAAQYSGDASYSSGYSNQQPLTVAPVPSVVTLVSVAPNPTAVGTATTATVTVGTVPPFGPPTGTITVFDTNGNSLCTITLPAVSCAFVPTAPGTQTVVARYEGDASYESGLSNPIPLISRAPPTIAKDFAPPGILVNGTSTLTFTLTNPNAGTALTGVAFTDPFPAGLAVAAAPTATTTGCGAPTFAPAAGSTSVSFSGGTIAASGTCTATVDVTATTGGVKANTTSAVTSTEGGTGGSAQAALVVVTPPAVAPPTIAKAFGAASLLVNGTTALTFTLTNPNPTPGPALTGVGFTDTLPAGLTVANGATATCGGTLTTSAGTTIALAGATIARTGTCTFSVSVTGTTAGAKDNVTGTVTSTEGGPGGTASASLAVVAPPTIAKSFGAASVAVNGTTTLTFLLTNPNAATDLTGVGFTDTLPAGLVVATPNGLTGACGGGTITATAGATSVGLAGATLAAGAPCQFAIDVLAVGAGAQANTTGAVTSANGGAGNAATASIDVLAAQVAAPIPALSPFALAVLAIGVLLIGLWRTHAK